MHQQPDKPRFQKIFFALGGSVVGIFALAVLLGIGLFRAEARKQVVQRDGALLTHVAQYLYSGYEETGIEDWVLVELAIDSSQIKGIIAVRVFSPVDSLIRQVPDSLYPVGIGEKDRAILDEGKPVIRYFPEFPLDSLFSDPESVAAAEATPMVEVIAPLTAAGGRVEAAIQYWLDGSSMAEEFDRLDRYLAIMGLLFILGGALIFSVVFLYARSRLLGMARLLAERNRSLEQANAELALAAKTSAIGSVASHLFHGLKNPLAGLKAYLRVTARDDEAVAIANRMQALIDETLSVIREQNEGSNASLEFAELLETTRRRLRETAPGADGRLKVTGSGEGCIPARKAQLLIFILRNLVENALQADQSEAPVIVNLDCHDSRLLATVQDKGPGLPESVKARLFEPVQSGKSNGTGIGLAISSVLARHIPASLELLASDAGGTTFEIRMSL